jgi:transposase-like protein
MPRMTQGISNTDPVCARCGSTMRFSCVEPEPNKPGFVHQVYECTKCRTTQSVVTRMD